jgi:serine/threonine-protein kinase
MLQVGDQFDHYQVRAHVAQGGMADIYTAFDLLNGREVAIKIPNRMLLGDPAQFERFQRELEVMRTLNHPAVQKGIESGTFNRTPYLVTNWVSGKSLRDRISEEAPLLVGEALDLIRKVAEGMAYCHNNGIVHRDLKPENILITPEGQPIILDFGIALTKDARRVTYANLSSQTGTAGYMAPEQIEGQRGDPRTDLYALGVILYEMLAGKPPYGGDNSMAVMAQHLRGGAPRLDHVRPEVSPQLATVVARSMARHPEDRYPDAKSFLYALDHLDAVDTSILSQLTGEAARVPFWRSQQFIAVVIAVLVLVGIVAVALVAQSLRGIP